MAKAVVCDQRQRRSGTAVHLERNRTLKPDPFPGVRRAQFAVERRVICFPDKLSAADSSPVDIAVTESKRRLSVAASLHLVHAPAFLFFLRLSRVEDDSVA